MATATDCAGGSATQKQEKEAAPVTGLYLHRFDGKSSYSIWRQRLKIFLKAKNLWRCCEQDAPVGQDVEWRTRCAEAEAFIYQGLEDDVIGVVIDADGPKEMVEKLDAKFIRRTMAEKISMTRDILANKYDGVTPLEEYFSQFDERIRRLRMAEGELSDALAVQYLLCAMPAAYDVVVDSIAGVEQREVSLVYVKNRLMERSRRLKEVTVPGQMQVSTLARRKITCFNCGMEGHVKRDCRKKPNRENRERYNGNNNGRSNHNGDNNGKNNYGNKSRNRDNGEIRCYKCGQTGHLRRGCRVRAGNVNNRNASNNNNVNYVANGNVNNDKLSNNNNRDRTAPPALPVERDFAMIITYREECLDLNRYANSIKDTYSSIKVFIDSGASCSLIGNRELLTNIKELTIPVEILVAKNNVSLRANVVGTLVLRLRNKVITLNNVYYVHELRLNLVSVNILASAGAYSLFREYDVLFLDRGTGEVLDKAPCQGGLYSIEIMACKITAEGSVAEGSVVTAAAVKGGRELAVRWHNRLGHVGQGVLKRLAGGGRLRGISASDCAVDCEDCTRAKQSAKPHFRSGERADRPADLVHMDLVGPVRVIAYTSCRYALTLVDDYSRYARVYTLSEKTEPLRYFKEYNAVVENRFGRPVLRLRVDNGTEFKNTEFEEYCSTKGITVEFVPPYSPESNGRIERYNRTIVERARAMLLASDVRDQFWPEALYAACYVYNRVANSTGTIPLRMWLGRDAPIDYENFHVFGCKCYVLRVPHMEWKFGEKSDEACFLGYATGGAYRVWNARTNRLQVSRDVKFYDDQMSGILRLQISRELEIFGRYDRDNMSRVEETIDLERFIGEEEVEDGYVNSALMAGLDGFCGQGEVPGDEESARKSSEWSYWRAAMLEELNAHVRNATWTEVDRPDGRKVLSCRWVYAKKLCLGKIRYKARLVIRGFEQRGVLSFRDVYAPVARMVAVRSVLAYANRENFEVQQLDVKNAFLHSQVKSEVYMEMPYVDDSDRRKNRVCRLRKALYGLKESPRCWNDCVVRYLESIGFVQASSDACIFLKRTDEEFIIVVIYVDDLLLIARSVASCDLVKAKLKERFNIHDIGEVREFLGVRISRDRGARLLTLDQADSIESLARKFSVIDTRPVSTPMEKGLDSAGWNSVSRVETSLPFRSLLGAIMYIMIATRVDVSFSVGFFSRFAERPDREKFRYLLRVLRYLWQTVNVRLCYSGRGDAVLDAYADASFASCPEDGRSVSGYVVRLFGDVVMWRSTKQTTVSVSTCEAEFKAAYEVSLEIIWFRKLLKDLSVACPLPIVIYEDNQGAIATSVNAKNSKRARHYNVKMFYLSELVAKGEIVLKYVPSDSQLADILTKSLDVTKFKRFCEKLGLT